MHREFSDTAVIVSVEGSLSVLDTGLVNASITTCHTVRGAYLTEGQDVIVIEPVREEPAEGGTGIEETVGIDRKRRRPVVTCCDVEEQFLVVSEGHVCEYAY